MRGRATSTVRVTLGRGLIDFPASINDQSKSPSEDFTFLRFTCKAHRFLRRGARVYSLMSLVFPLRLARKNRPYDAFKGIFKANRACFLIWLSFELPNTLALFDNPLENSVSLHSLISE